MLSARNAVVFLSARVLSRRCVAHCSPVHLRSLLDNHGANINNPRVHGYLMAISFGLLVRTGCTTSRQSLVDPAGAPLQLSC